MTEKMTRKEMFYVIAEVMGAEYPEIAEFAEKQIAALSRPRKPRVNTAAIEFAAKVLGAMPAEPITNKEMTALMNADAEDEIKPQKVAAAFKRLVAEGKVIRHEGEKKADPATFVVA